MSEPSCKRCDDTGWKPAIGPCRDGSYITSRPCTCAAYHDWCHENEEWKRERLAECLAKRAAKAEAKHV